MGDGSAGSTLKRIAFSGCTIAPDGDTVNVYYGAADSSIALATGSVRALLDWLG